MTSSASSTLCRQPVEAARDQSLRQLEATVKGHLGARAQMTFNDRQPTTITQNTRSSCTRSTPSRE
eukprot:15455450-Alexandrium_andersonii.AAC.1